MNLRPLTRRRPGSQRTLADWTPKDGEQPSWLVSWEAEGRRPEYPLGGTVVRINGREVARFTMIRDDDES